MSSSRKIQHFENWPRFTLKLVDAFAIVLGLWVLIVWVPEFNSKSTLVASLVAIGLFSLTAELAGVYRNWRGIAFEREAVCTMIAWVITVVLLLALGQLSANTTELSAPALLIWFSITPVFSLTGRIMSRWIIGALAQRNANTRNFAVIGMNQLGAHLVENVHASPELGLKFLGYYDDRPENRLEDEAEEPGETLGRFDDLVENARQGTVEVVFICLPLRAEKRIRDFIQRLYDTTVSVYIVPDLFTYQMLNARWTDIQGLPVVSVSENPFYGVDGMLKRVVDVSLSLVALAVAAIPLAIIAAAVKLTSRGPVFFKQKRYGLDGKEINVLKFRSMTCTEDGEHVVQATRNDKRVTPLGAFLRRTSLDELPQLFNVLAGSMSLVGPRPHANAHNEYYRKEIEGYMMRHKVKPGITGLAQVNGCRGETETVEKMEQRVTFDHQYIREWTIWLDLRILFQTIWVVLKRENAY